jgi:hypothetical protein
MALPGSTGRDLLRWFLPLVLRRRERFALLDRGIVRNIAQTKET